MTLILLRIKNNLTSSILKYKNIFDQQTVFILGFQAESNFPEIARKAFH